MFQNYLDRSRIKREEFHWESCVRESFMHGLVGEIKLIRRRSFTLIEFLVIMAVIGILTSILLPSLRNSRMKVKSSVCLNNLNQIGLGASLYAMNNSYRFPYYHRNRNGDVWFRSPLRPYLGNDENIQKQIQRCLTTVDTWIPFGMSPTPENTYAMSRRVSGDPNIGNLRDFRSVIQTSSPSESVSFLDGSEYRYTRFGLKPAGIKWFAGSNGSGHRYHVTDMIHDNGINSVYVDGHAKKVSSSKILGYDFENSKFWNPLK